MDVRAVADAERERTVAFLRTQGYAQPIQPEDRVFATLHGEEVIAAVRLALEEGVVVLRGMRVREDQQRRGVGRALLRETVGFVGEAPCYCIAYAWLEDFYGEVGFRVTAPAEAPSFLASRFARYVQEGSSVILMRRPGGP